MKKLLAVALILLPSYALADDKILGSCVYKEDHACVEYIGVMSVVPEQYCKGELRKGATPCPTENALGYCDQKVTEGVERQFTYKSNMTDEQSAKTVCELSGTWKSLAKKAEPKKNDKPKKK